MSDHAAGRSAAGLIFRLALLLAVLAVPACSRADPPVADVRADDQQVTRQEQWPQPAIEPLVQVEIVAATGRHGFEAEVARTDRQQRIGMMGRRAIAADRAMLFVFSRPQPLSFWMHNTIIPLDMLFIGADGRVLNIVANAEPLSLEPRASAGPAVAVLEVAGGTAMRLGLAPGDQVTSPALNR